MTLRVIDMTLTEIKLAANGRAKEEAKEIEKFINKKFESFENETLSEIIKNFTHKIEKWLSVKNERDLLNSVYELGLNLEEERKVL